jgi:hypothetical protein
MSPLQDLRRRQGTEKRRIEVTSRAVVIGPANYAPGSGIGSHPEIGNSARLYGEILAADRRWNAGRVEVLSANQLPSIDGVMEAVQRAAGQTVPGDTLLVIYVGHGDYWVDVPGAEVHFAVGSSRRYEPHTWLNSWYVYRVIRRSKASLKVLVADCCCSNQLRNLGGKHWALPGVLGQQGRDGTCVFTAVKNIDQASAVGCPELLGELADCTPFSGHLLNLLLNGTEEDNDELTLGMIRDAVEDDMSECGTEHDEPRMILNDARESMALFTNQKARSERKRRPPTPASAEEWARIMKHPTEDDLDQLLADPPKTGKVVAILSKKRDGHGQGVARHISERADREFQNPAVFARYWAEAKRALPA